MSALITSRPGWRGGRWCIAGTRLWPWLLASRVAAGDAVQDVAEDFGVPAAAVDAACVLYRIRAGSVTLHVEAPVAEAEHGLPVVFGTANVGALIGLIAMTCDGDGARGAVVLDARGAAWQAKESNGSIRLCGAGGAVWIGDLRKRPDLFPFTVLWIGGDADGPDARECATDAPDGAAVEVLL